MMNQTTQNILLILLLITSVLLAPAFMGGSIIDSFAEEDDLGDRDEFALIGTFSVLWIRIPVHQMSVLFGLGISIFALFGVYVGGRSKRNLFNDRTIDAFNSLTISTGGYAYFMQIIKALISCLTLLMGSPVHGMRIFVPARMPSTVHSRPIFIRRVKL
jgi:hypothetical protein